MYMFYFSKAHYSTTKSVTTLGLGTKSLKKVKTDSRYVLFLYPKKNTLLNLESADWLFHFWPSAYSPVPRKG